MNRLSIVLICALYVVCPIDVAPEILLGPLGLIDDAVVGLIGLRKLVQG